MTVWAWLKFTIFLWLLRKTLKLAGWLLLAVVVIAAWPVTVVAAAGYAAAWLRGWPPVRLYRAAAWALPATRRRGWPPWRSGPRAGARRPGSRPGVGARLGPPGRAGPGPGVRGAGPGRAPGRAGAGRADLGVAELRHHRRARRDHGLGADHLRRPAVEAAGPHRPGPDQRPRRRPAAHPRRDTIPVGGTIRAIGHPWHPVLTLPAASCARHMVIVGATGSGKTNLMIRLWAGWFTATLQAVAGRAGGPAAAGRAGLQGRPRRPPESRPHPPPALRRRAPAGSPSGRTRPGCPCGTSRRTTWPCCCTR